MHTLTSVLSLQGGRGSLLGDAVISRSGLQIRDSLNYCPSAVYALHSCDTSRSPDQTRHFVFHDQFTALILDALSISHDASASGRNGFRVQNFNIDPNGIVHLDGTE